MKKKKLKVEKKTKEVERIKCDDCGFVTDKGELNIIALDLETIKKKSGYSGSRRKSNEWQRWSTGPSWYSRTKGMKMSAEAHLDLCDDCLEKHLHDGNEHKKDAIDRELEREMV